MKDLYKGDLVFHKIYKLGIVQSDQFDRVVHVHFQYTKNIKQVPRVELFKRGDLVEFKAKDGTWKQSIIATFHAWMDHNPRNETNFTVYKQQEIQGRSKRVIAYAVDIRHKNAKQYELHDIHLERAEIEGISRQEAKICNFGELYGMSLANAVAMAAKQIRPSLNVGGIVPAAPSMSFINDDKLDAMTSNNLYRQIDKVGINFKELEQRIATIDTNKEGKYAMLAKLRIMQLHAELDEKLKELEK